MTNDQMDAFQRTLSPDEMSRLTNAVSEALKKARTPQNKKVKGYRARKRELEAIAADRKAAAQGFSALTTFMALNHGSAVSVNGVIAGAGHFRNQDDEVPSMSSKEAWQAFTSMPMMSGYASLR